MQGCSSGSLFSNPSEGDRRALSASGFGEMNMAKEFYRWLSVYTKNEPWWFNLLRAVVYLVMFAVLVLTVEIFTTGLAWLLFETVR